ncbi:MAG: AI-2E family transporter [Syntrophomonadaceae bacterium]|jgi:predicted PurR-regulated permease PerM
MAVISRKTGRYFLFAMVVLTTICFLYWVREVVITFLIGAVLAYIIYRPVIYLENKGMARIWAIVLLYILVLGIMVVFTWLAIPQVIAELKDIAQIIPRYADQAQNVAVRVEHLDWPKQLQQIVKENTSRVEQYIYSSIKSFIAVFYKFLSKILIVVFAPILAFYMLKDWEKIKGGFLSLLSPKARRNCQVVGREIDIVLVNFLKGHLLVACLVGLTTGLAAFIIGVRFALLIGLISGITNLVPYFGPFLGGIPAVALAFAESSRTAIYMALAIVVIQQVESNFITPRIIGDRLGLHPLVIIFALMTGGQLLGIWGMLLAVPVTAMLKVIANFVFFKMVEQ